MKKEGHPPYQEVVFIDSSSGKRFVCGTTLKTSETIQHEGKEYPAYTISVSSASHPFYIGSGDFVDTEGRVEKFKKRYEKAAKKKEEQIQKEASGKEEAKKKEREAKQQSKRTRTKKTTAKKEDKEKSDA